MHRIRAGPKNYLGTLLRYETGMGHTLKDPDGEENKILQSLLKDLELSLSKRDEDVRVIAQKMEKAQEELDINRLDILNSQKNHAKLMRQNEKEREQKKVFLKT